MKSAAFVTATACSAVKIAHHATAEAISRRRELPALARKILRQSIPPGPLFFRATLLTCVGVSAIVYAEPNSKVELLGYLLLLMAFNQTAMQFVWRSIDNFYRAIERQFGLESKDVDEDV